jgi:hypothetical protein
MVSSQVNECQEYAMEYHRSVTKQVFCFCATCYELAIHVPGAQDQEPVIEFLLALILLLVQYCYFYSSGFVWHFGLKSIFPNLLETIGFVVFSMATKLARGICKLISL